MFNVNELKALSRKYLEKPLTMYWSRCPGKFVSSKTGKEVGEDLVFSGSVREWYETLAVAILDVVSATGIEKTDARLSVGPDVLTIMECTLLYKPLLFHDSAGDILKDDLGSYLEHEVYKGTLNGMRVLLNPDQPGDKILVFDSLLEKVGVVEILDMYVI